MSNADKKRLRAEVDALLERAAAESAAGRHDAAADLCRQALARKPDDLDALFCMGAAAQEAGDADAAAALYRRVLATDTSHRAAATARAHANLGGLLAEREEYAAAAAELAEAARIDEGADVATLVALGDCLAQDPATLLDAAARYDAALASPQQSAAESDAEVLKKLAAVCLEAGELALDVHGDSAQALALLQRADGAAVAAVELAPGDADALVLRGSVLAVVARGWPEGAEEGAAARAGADILLRQAAAAGAGAADPDVRSRALGELGDLWLVAGRRTRAPEHLQAAADAFRADAGEPTSLYNLACCAALAGALDEARAALEASGASVEEARADEDLQAAFRADSVALQPHEVSGVTAGQNF